MQFDTGGKSAYRQVQNSGGDDPIPTCLMDFLVELRSRLHNSDDLVIQQHSAGGVQLAVVMFEGLVSNMQVSRFLLAPLAKTPADVDTPQEVLDYLRHGMMAASDQKEARTYGEVINFAMSGFAVVVVDGMQAAVVLGYQGFATRGISEPSSENNLKGSHEGFCEAIVINVSMVRRRIKSPMLTVESMKIGGISNTSVKLLYLSGVASQQMVDQVRLRLSAVKVDMLIDSGCLRPFLDDRKFSLFSGTGSTERPDTLCAKIGEGRVAVMVDGTPFALIVPYLFAEHFQTMDDYSQRPYFATFIRTLKLLSFLATVLLPGYYVGVISFHPELIPEVLLDSFVRSVVYTPLPAMGEALIVFVLYELLREAGLRLPRPIGHAISIVGGLVIGDAAVTAGLVGLPMVILIAITAVSSFVVPSLYEPVTVLRFTFILVGGTLGLFGVYLGFGLLLINLCSLKTLGIPITAPVSPFDSHAMRDVLVRAGWKKLENGTLEVDKLPGVSPK